MTTAAESGTTATIKHTACIISPKSILGEKKHQTCTMRYGTNACHSLVSSVDTLSTYYDLRVAQLNIRRNDDFFPLFFVSKMYDTPSLHAIKYVTDKSIWCVMEHRCAWSVWSYSYVPVLLTREYKPCRFVRTCVIPPSRPRGRSYSQCCCVAFSGAVIVTTITSSSFQSCVRLPRLYPCMYVYLPKFNK